MLVTVSHVAKAYANEIVLEDVSFRVARGSTTALVGRNGCGKSTLLRILVGEESADAGSVNLAAGTRLSYMRQSQTGSADRTVWEEVMLAQSELAALRDRLDQLSRRMEAGDADPETLEEFTVLQERFLDEEGYSLDHDAKSVLSRLGIEEPDFGRKIGELSGGQATRVAIARMLLAEPDLIVFDEPTNHLDLVATEWLERWINGFHGTVLVVSHDRRFLEATANSFVEIRNGRASIYPGNYGQYVRLRAEEAEQTARTAKKEAAQAAALDEYVRRFMGSERTAQARGRQKQLEKLEASRTQVQRKERAMAAGFDKASRSGVVSVECKALEWGYDGIPLLPELDWTVRYGERWGVVGENGAGKSTLVKTMVGKKEPVSGVSKLGSGVTVGYFAQDAEELDPARSALHHLVYGFDLTEGQARNLLGRFLFEGDDVLRPVSSLSGGERNKLVLAMLTQSRPNLLVLDEPTNHLDMDSREAMAETLAEFVGTLILVSHDRWLLGELTDNTLDVRRTGCVHFPGSFNEYRAKRCHTEENRAKNEPNRPPAPVLTPRELSKAIQDAAKEVERTESEVGRLEDEIASLNSRLAAPEPDDDLTAMGRDHADQTAAIARAIEAWEAAILNLERLEQLQG
ncbi:MAG: ATP-binding cassette domain-containing protein [Fimbriimonadaceae bacterium]